MRLYDLTKSIKKSKTQSTSIFYGKVVEVHYNTQNPDSIGAITFKNITDVENVSRGEAYPLSPFITQPPLVDEVVLLVNAPSEVAEEGEHTAKIYYLGVVNIWNHPHHSGIVGNKQFPELGTDFKERTDINPILPYQGDTILQGRLGQSLRFSQTIPNITPWTGTVLGNPVIVLSNGQITTETGFEFINEDINADFSSIYLTSKQGIPLKESQTFNTFSAPTTSAYETSQVILNGDRLIFNSKLDSILLTSSTQVGIKGIDTNIEGTQTITLEAPRISLGFQAEERAVLGDSMVEELTKLYTDLKNVIKELGILGSVVSYTPMIQVATTALTNIELRENQLKSRLLSNKTYLSK